MKLRKAVLLDAIPWNGSNYAAVRKLVPDTIPMQLRMADSERPGQHDEILEMKTSTDVHKASETVPLNYWIIVENGKVSVVSPQVIDSYERVE